MALIFPILIIVLAVVSLICIVIINKKYKALEADCEILLADIEGKKKALDLERRENETLKKEICLLQEQKKVAKKENVKTPEELPKQEKVTKPRKATTKK